MTMPSCTAPVKTTPMNILPISILKYCGDLFGPIITRLVDLSFTEGKFLEMFKVGQVTSLLQKSGAVTSDMLNFRPITNLNTIVKILECLKLKQLRHHIKCSPNIDPLQAAYWALQLKLRWPRWFMTCWLLLTANLHLCCCHWISAELSALSAAIASFNLRKNCSALLTWYSIGYSCGRKHFVAVDCWLLSTFKLSAGVPQGSVLGSVLFGIFTTPVEKLINSYDISYHQFADDTRLYTAIKSLSPSNLAVISVCADAVTGWHIMNDLLLNPTKMKALLTCTRQQVMKLDQSGGIPVFDVDVLFISKLWVLGVKLDCHLSFDDLITNDIRVCNYHIRALHPIHPLIKRETTYTIACSLVCTRLA